MKSDMYIVKKGDTLWDIADRFYRDPYAYPNIYLHNNRPSIIKRTGSGIVDADLIYPGQKLVIPYIFQADAKSGKSKQERKPSLKDDLSTEYVFPITKYKFKDRVVHCSDYGTFKATVYLSGEILIKSPKFVSVMDLTNTDIEIVTNRSTGQVFDTLLTAENQVTVDHNRISYTSMLLHAGNGGRGNVVAIGFHLSSDSPFPILRGEFRVPEIRGRYNGHDYVGGNIKGVIDVELRGRVGNKPGPDILRDLPAPVVSKDIIEMTTKFSLGTLMVYTATEFFKMSQALTNAACLLFITPSQMRMIGQQGMDAQRII